MARLRRGSKDVGTAGVAEPLGDANIKVRALTIRAKNSNTGRVWIGEAGTPNNDNDEGVLADDGLAITYDREDPPGYGVLGDLWVNANVSGEGVVFWFLQLHL